MVAVVFVGVFGIDSAFAGYILFGYGSTAAVATLIAGVLCDKFNVWIVTAVFLSISCGAFVCIAISTNLAMSIVMTIVSAIGTLCTNTCC